MFLFCSIGIWARQALGGGALGQKRRLLALQLALALVSLTATGASADDPASIERPANMTTCQFDALADDSGSRDVAVRDAPRADARVLGQLASIEDNDRSFSGANRERAEFRVIGFNDGWFLIEGANYPETPGLSLYAGQGWIEGKAVTTRLFRDTLRSAPNHEAPDVVYLHGADKDGLSYSPYDIEIARILGCSGPWFHVEILLPDAKNLAGAPASPDGKISGWTDRACVDEGRACGEKQFDYSWSPLPAGVTECNFGALSNDPDPKGLNVRAAPDKGARIVGHVQTPFSLDRDTKELADVHVIGFRKGWFLVALGPYQRDSLPPHGPKPFTGRGWVAGEMLTTELLRNKLKQAPDEKSADEVDLAVDNGDGNAADPQNVKMRRILACSGDWLKVEVTLTKGMKPRLATDAPKGAVSGWANGSCTAQLTTCDFDQSRPWSPPAPLPVE
jgi:hypothetical protein